MSYGHAEKIAAIAAGMAAAGSEKPTAAIDPTLYHRDDLRAVLAATTSPGCTSCSRTPGSPSAISQH